MFGLLEPAAQSFVCEHLQGVNLPGGAVLIQQGDAADCLYLVAVGRLRVSMRGDDGSDRVIAELGRGEVVGELAVITNEPRSATVTALRDSEVFKLSTSAFAQLVEEHPEALREIATPVVRRLVRSLREGSPSSPVVTIAVVPLGADPTPAEFGVRLHHALERLTGAASHVNALTTAASLGDLTRVSAERLALWFGEHDSRSKAVVYEADAGPTPWTDTCVRQADMVLLVGSSRERPELRPVELAIAERRRLLKTRTELVLVHPSTTRDPRATRRWLEQREVDRHHHVRIDRDGDVERVARLILGQRDRRGIQRWRRARHRRNRRAASPRRARRADRRHRWYEHRVAHSGSCCARALAGRPCDHDARRRGRLLSLRYHLPSRVVRSR